MLDFFSLKIRCKIRILRPFCNNQVFISQLWERLFFWKKNRSKKEKLEMNFCLYSILWFFFKSYILKAMQRCDILWRLATNPVFLKRETSIFHPFCQVQAGFVKQRILSSNLCCNKSKSIFKGLQWPSGQRHLTEIQDLRLEVRSSAMQAIIYPEL